VVDVLISTTYASAGEGALDPRPLGLGLRVPLPSVGYAPVAARAMMVFDPAGAPVVLPTAPDPAIGSDQLVDFDQLSLPKVRTLPFIGETYLPHDHSNMPL
jgi:hypothetical protein